MNQSLYRLQSRAGLSLASTAAGAASEDSGSVRADVLSHLVGCEKDRQGHEKRTHTMNTNKQVLTVNTEQARRIIALCWKAQGIV
mgnify:CR=1 FL=1